MPREVPVNVRRPAARRPGRFLLLAALAMLHAAAVAGQLTVSIEIAPAGWKTVHLKNMPKDAPVAIQVESSGDIRVAFVHGDEFRRFPAAVTPEFQGKVDRKLSFSLSIPRDGDYYLILDNRKGEGTRKIRVRIRAEKPGTPGSPSPQPGAGRNGETRT